MGPQSHLVSFLAILSSLDWQLGVVDFSPLARSEWWAAPAWKRFAHLKRGGLVLHTGLAIPFVCAFML